MNYDEAMEATKSGKTVVMPHWNRIGVKLHNGKLRIVDENDKPGEIYRPLKSEKDATDWSIR